MVSVQFGKKHVLMMSPNHLQRLEDNMDWNSEKYCIKWTDFDSNFKNSFRNFRHTKEFSDVIIMGDDLKKIHVHRIVLVTCSKYFGQILKEFKDNYFAPIVVLEGLMATNLENIMDYIYNGEVQVHQQDLDSFLKIAKRLQLDGLIPETSHCFSQEDKTRPGVDRVKPEILNWDTT